MPRDKLGTTVVDSREMGALNDLLKYLSYPERNPMGDQTLSPNVSREVPFISGAAQSAVFGRVPSDEDFSQALLVASHPAFREGWPVDRRGAKALLQYLQQTRRGQGQRGESPAEFRLRQTERPK